jgi:hypothetical protein
MSFWDIFLSLILIFIGLVTAKKILNRYDEPPNLKEEIRLHKQKKLEEKKRLSEITSFSNSQKMNSSEDKKKSPNPYLIIFIIYVIVGLFVVRTPDWDYKAYVLYFGIMSFGYWALKDIVTAIMQTVLGDIIKFYGMMFFIITALVLFAFFLKMILGG